MGHKAHPIGLRLGIHRKWKSNWFLESKNYTKFLHLHLNIEKFFQGFFYFFKINKTLILKTQIIKLSNNQLFIVIYYYRFRKKIKKYLQKPIKNQNFLNWQVNLEKYFANKKIKNVLQNKLILNDLQKTHAKQLLIIFKKINLNNIFQINLKKSIIMKKNFQKNIQKYLKKKVLFLIIATLTQYFKKSSYFKIKYFFENFFSLLYNKVFKLRKLNFFFFFFF